MTRAQSLLYLFRQMAGTIRRYEDLVVEDGEVKRETQSNGVSRLQLNFAHVKRFLIGLLGLLHDS